MTDYEIAQIRLRAWEAVSGWGNTSKVNDKEELKIWGWSERMKFADELANWALNTSKQGQDA
jgi:hypothetical protein